MRFYNQSALYLLLLLPILIALYIIGARLIKRRLARLGGNNLERLAQAGLSYSKRRLKLALTIIGIAFMIIALARPQYGSELVKVKTTGSQVIIALDISLSMLAGDFYPNRLEKAKREIISLLENIPGENVGLIVFTGQAFVQCPLTVDYGAFRMFLDVVNVGMISDTGTDIEKAIEKAAEGFSNQSSADKVMVIFTDGEEQDGDALSAAQKYKDQFRIFTIGVGTPNGEPIPIRRPDGVVDGYKKDIDGQLVISKLNQRLLSDIASVANGVSYLATPGEEEIKSLVNDIKGLKKGETEGSFRRIYKEEYQYLLFPGILFMALGMLISERKKYEN
ncbi:MAG: VWA domain-containing protein [candidate division Zixibacteria bacterium]|nr:VWA domain-containing protein [candidate division Zixibacteria bacterium]